jgi:hypothetical protein
MRGFYNYRTNESNSRPWIARSSLIAQAATPSIGALLFQHLGTEGMLGAVSLLALLNVGLVGALFLRVAATRRQAAGLPIA